MKKSEGAGPKTDATSAQAADKSQIVSTLLVPASSPVEGAVVLPLTRLTRVLLPPLLISSLQKRAIGFSFPRGGEGKVLGLALLVSTGALAYLMDVAFGFFAAVGIVWLMGGTAAVILYNSTRYGLAFVKEMCWDCRLRPIIVEHELMHLQGEPSEEAVWKETKKRYSYDNLGLGTDPKIHSFCPIAKRLKETA